jgi:hypothetical protein
VALNSIMAAVHFFFYRTLFRALFDGKRRKRGKEREREREREREGGRMEEGIRLLSSLYFFRSSC